MADNVNIITGEDVVNIVDPTTSLDIAITEESVNVGNGVDVVSVTPELETVQVGDAGDEINITEVVEELPQANDAVIVQIVEDANVPYAKRVDFIGDTLIYRAEAVVGSLENAAAWRIRRLTIDVNSDDDIKEEWANGNATFDKIWNDRLTLDYS